MHRALRILALGLALVAAFGVAGCGNKEDEVLEALTEGPYIDIGEVKYQVQMSRELNPYDIEDQGYLKGLPEGTETPGPEEVFFGVWMRAENVGSEPAPAVREFEIIDTQEKIYRPVPLDTEINVFAYQPRIIPSQELIPAADSAAATGPIQGSLVLFRLSLESYQNRPLQLRFQSPTEPGKEGVIDLDL